MFFNNLLVFRLVNKCSIDRPVRWAWRRPRLARVTLDLDGLSLAIELGARLMGACDDAAVRRRCWLEREALSASELYAIIVRAR